LMRDATLSMAGTGAAWCESLDGALGVNDNTRVTVHGAAKFAGRMSAVGS